MAKRGGSAKQGGLGRGLGALIVKTDDAPIDSVPAASAKANASAGFTEQGAEGQSEAMRESGVSEIAVSLIAPNPHQPRSIFAPEALEELASSIREHGIIQPLIVTIADQATDQQDKRAAQAKYWLIAGERRWRAAQIAGLASVPVIVREASTSQLMEWALVENIQRADLNALEEAAAFQAMMDELSLTQAEVADRVGKSRSAVANTLRLQQLPSSAQDALVEGRISAGHARALLGLVDTKTISSTLEIVLAQDLSVRQTESLIKKMLEPSNDELIQPDADLQQMGVHLAHLEDRFRMALNTRVSLSRQSDGTGKLVVHFYNDDDLDSIYQHIAGRDEI